ncbi:hypothetical protein B0H66DRAFT_540418 [Apodospora peruviana]|uniref:Uncharacterized protein n=1 Tax=Apodospora peruviana TaxID=516989 RepID=A0AAE0IQB0_9PEZI|nr:hypothetical protein B0H66DRAFT_540418 [Apodospora peruviana]
MDKCWFVLGHVDITPPDIPQSGTGFIKGPLCPGHLVPGPPHLDEVINGDGPEEVPPDMPIRLVTSTEFSWQNQKGRTIAPSASVEAPITTTVGITGSVNAAIAFKKTTSQHWQFASLDTYTFHPTREYIEDSLENEHVAAFITNKKRPVLGTWHVFMVTGIKIARGAAMSQQNTRLTQVNGGARLSASGVIGVQAGMEVFKDSETLISQNSMSDFVWAVRLAKITKGVLDTTWSHMRYYSKAATFSLEVDEDEKVDHEKTLSNADIEPKETYELEDGEIAVRL